MIGEQRRRLILLVANDNPKALPYLYQFDQLVYAERFFAWLVRNQITGDRFVEFYEVKFQYSFKAFVEFIMKKIKDERPLLRSDLK